MYCIIHSLYTYVCIVLYIVYIHTYVYTLCIVLYIVYIHTYVLIRIRCFWYSAIGKLCQQSMQHVLYTIHVC